MIHLVNLNPALDFFFRLEESAHGKIGKISKEEMAAGGKSLNVARFLKKLKTPSRLWIGTGSGAESTHIAYRALLKNEGLKADFFENPSPVRMNLVIEKSGTSRKYNHEGYGLSSTLLRRFQNKLQKVLRQEDYLVLTGRLPQSNQNVFSSLIRGTRRRGVSSVVDTSDAALTQALAIHPWFFKVNLFEMEEGLKLKLGNLGKLTTLIPLLRKRGLVHGAVTHGSQGSVLWNEREVWEVKFQVKSQKLVVGAGDGFLAGYLKASHDKRPLVERARWACAAGAAVAAHGITGFQLTTVQRFLNRVQVRKIS